MPVLSTAAAEAKATGPNAFGTAALFILAIAVGSALSLGAPDMADGLAAHTDTTLLVLIFLLFFELRFDAVVKAFGKFQFLALAWAANFLIVPIIAFAIASLLLQGQPILFAGLMIYFLAPCTDWFLGFTRMARGDTELGAALIPVNLITQLMLFPLWLWLFTPAIGSVDFRAMPELILQWFLLPMALAQVARAALTRVLPEPFLESLFDKTSVLLSLTLALLITQIFAGHVGAILAQGQLFGIVALAVILFFALTYATGRALTRLARLDHPQQALLAMTMAARNAPLMLALTAVALPDQPLVLAVIVFGMLVEIPHLTFLRQLLLRQSHVVELPLRAGS